MTLSEIDLEEPDSIIKYTSFGRQLVWYTTKVGPEVENAARELAVYMSHPRPRHWKVLGRLIGYLKGKETKGIIILKPKVLKAVMLYYSNYATDKETRNSVSGFVATLGGTLLTCLSTTQITVTLISKKAEYVALSACAQEVKFISMLLGEMNKVEKPYFIYEDKQGAIFLAYKRQVGICTYHVDIRHHFLRDVVEEKYIDVK